MKVKISHWSKRGLKGWAFQSYCGNCTAGPQRRIKDISNITLLEFNDDHTQLVGWLNADLMSFVNCGSEAGI